MTTKKTFILRSIDLIPGLGNDHDGIPFRWLSSMVEKVRAQVPDDEGGVSADAADKLRELLK